MNIFIKYFKLDHNIYKILNNSYITYSIIILGLYYNYNHIMLILESWILYYIFNLE